MKIQLPNGCSCSQLSVNPKNWHTKSASTTIDWFISYRFYDSKFVKPKQVAIRGMNSFKKLEERQNETKRLIEEELKKLQQGCSPFVKQATSETGQDDSKLSFLTSLKIAFKHVSVSDTTKMDLKFSLKQIEGSINILGWKELLTSEVSRKHIRKILDGASLSDDRFNKNRSYLMILLSVLCELEMIEHNFARDIKKRKTVKRIRETLSDSQRIEVNDYLTENHPEFHRFLHIFFHSGARIKELINIRSLDVDLANQRFKVIVRKGGSYQEVWKVIKDIALPFWEEIMNDATQEDYVFSKGLKPGKELIKSYQIDKRWYRLVKKQLGITADFYSLKHLHTTEVVDFLDAEKAAKHNSHLSTNMVNQVYDVKKHSRNNGQVKSLENPFA